MQSVFRRAIVSFGIMAIAASAAWSDKAGINTSSLKSPGTPSYGYALPPGCTDSTTCVGLPGDGFPHTEKLQVCKYYPANEPNPPAVQVLVEAKVGNPANYTDSPRSLTYTIAANSCVYVWRNGEDDGQLPDTLTVTEIVPAGWVSTSQLSTIIRVGPRQGANNVFNTVVYPVTSSPTVTALIAGPQIPGALVVFRNERANSCPAQGIASLLGPTVTNRLFLFTNGSTDANWQGASKGFVGDAVVNGILAHERTSGSFAYAGTISTNDVTLGAWQSIVNNNVGQAFASTGQTALVSQLTTDLTNAFASINALPVTAGYANRSSASLNGINTQNGVPETIVINVTSGFQMSSQLNITGDAGDLFILRWDTDANFANGYQGQVKFQSGGAIVPKGGLTPANFIHVAGDIGASGGGSTPAAPYPQGPRFNNGTGALAAGASNFSGGGFFTGYWLTTGDPVTHETSSLSNAIFVGGWYSTTTKFSMTSGTSGVNVVCQ